MKRVLLFAVLLLTHVGFGQCPFGGSQVGATQSICYNTEFSNNNFGSVQVTAVPVGGYVAVKVISGLKYNIIASGSVGFIKRITLFNAINNATNVGSAVATSNNGNATLSNWTATFTGDLLVRYNNNSNCSTTSGTSGTITVQYAGGSNVDSQTTVGTDSWIGHVYDFSNNADIVPFPPSNTNAFANYLGSFTQVNTVSGTTRQFDQNYGGNDNCFSFTAGGISQTVRTDSFAVRYRMQTTPASYPAGCYFVTVRGDDGVRLYIDGVLVFNAWAQQPSSSFNNVLVSLSGNSLLEFDFYEKNGGNVSNFSISPVDAAALTSINTITPSGTTTRCVNTSTTLTGSPVATQDNTNNTIPSVSFQWQSSNNNSSWSDISGATAQNYTVAGTSPSVATQIYYRRNLKGGTANSSSCVYGSNVVSVVTTSNTAPARPASSAGTNVSCSSFTSNWASSPTATSYRLDVSTVNTFTSFVAGYENLNVGFVTSYNVSGLPIGTYYYRVRAVNGCTSATSGDSTVVQTVTTVNPSVTISGSTTVCQNAALPYITFKNSIASAITVVYTINGGSNQNINVGANTTANVAAPTAATGTFTYSLVSVAYQANPFCSTSISGAATINVNDLPQGSLTANGPFCATGSGQLTWTATAGTGPYTVVYNDGVADRTVTGVISGTPFATFNTPVTATTTYTLVSVTGANTCSRTTGFTGGAPILTVIPLPSTPTVATTVQPNCITATGSVRLTGLPSGSWTLVRSGFSSQSTGGTGSETTISGLAPGTYQFAVTSGSCTSTPTGNVVIDLVTTTTYTASGWSVTPTIDMLGVINSNIPITTNVELCNCTVNATDAVVAFGKTLKLRDKLTVNGSLTFENTANLVQENNVVNTGNIKYQRETTPIKKFDFTYWSSPVSGQKLFDLSPLTNPGKYYSFNSSTGAYAVENPQNLMGKGIGYIIRAPENTATPPAPLSPYLAIFEGVPHNGTITLSPVLPFKAYLIGNPYPSALDADAFIAANANVLFGTLYFWTHNTARGVGVNNPGSGYYAYSADDYATYNTTGGVAVAASDSNKDISNPYRPTGKIAAGQAFFASTIENMIGTSIVFNNSMRLGVGNAILDNSQFFKTTSSKSKTASSVERHRLWLNLTNAQGAFKQMLVGYISGATNNYDTTFDGTSYNGNKFLDFYSVNNNKMLTIQGRALPFEESDEVQLGYSSTIQGSFSISIDQVDGVLASRKIYLEDKIKNITHDLKQGPYTFETATGTFNTRFVLRYTDKTLGVDDIDLKKKPVVVSVKNKLIKVESGAESIDKIFVYTLSGAVVYEKQKVDAAIFTIPSLSVAQQVLIVKTVLQDGSVTTTKIIY